MIYLGADHRGFELKGKIKGWLTEWGYEFEDMGNDKYDPDDDYADYGLKVAEKVGSFGGVGTVNSVSGIDGARGGRGSDGVGQPSPRLRPVKGILVCGSGVGMSIAANRVNGVGCGLCTSVGQTVAARKEDDINCLALTADYTTEDMVKQIVKAFLETEFRLEERYVRRVNKLNV